jgi:Uma2 family endonuclease
MVAYAKWPYITPEEYLRREKEAETKSEYIDGVIVAMAGASRSHIRITMNLTIELDPHLERAGCEGYASDMRVRVQVSNRYYYPDVAIACGEPEFDTTLGLDALLNPSLIIEVLSRSTDRADHAEKWLAYRQLESLNTYILVHQDRTYVEMYDRDNATGTWEYTDVTGLGSSLKLSSLGCEIPLARIYRRVVLRQPDEIS